MLFSVSRDINDSSLLQFITSYSIFESFELSVSFNSIFFSLDKYNHPTDSNGNLSTTHYSKNTVNFGIGYIL